MLAIYTRLSREDEDSNSIKNQLREGKLFAKKNEFVDVNIYNEGEGVSGGADRSDRPQLDRLMTDMEDGYVDAVWFRHQDRLERNTNTYLKFVLLVQSMNTTVYFADRQVDFNDPDHELQGGLLSFIGQYQRKIQSKKTKKALRDNFEEGKTHGITPYGYTKDANRYMIIDDDEAKVVRQIFKWSLKGIGTNKIAEKLNELNTPTRYNKIGKGTISTKNKYHGTITTTKKSDVKWAGNTVRNIIKNTIYKGVRYSKANNLEYKSPIIIKPLLWLKVNENLKNNRNNSGKSVEHKYLLKGKLICGRCGRNYYGRTRVNKKDNYYMCSSKRIKSANCGNRSINIDVLEDFIWQRFFVDKIMLSLIENYYENNDLEEKIIRTKEAKRFIDREIKANKKRQNKTRDYIRDGTFTKEDGKADLIKFKRELEELEIRSAHYSEELESYKKLISKADLNILSIKSVKKNASFNEKKKIIGNYIKNVKVSYFNLEYVDMGYMASKGIYKIDINFNIESIEPERFYLNRQYHFAIHKNYKLVIPLSDIFKEFSKEDLVSVTELIFLQVGYTKLPKEANEDERIFAKDFYVKPSKEYYDTIKDRPIRSYEDKDKLDTIPF